MNLYKKTIPQIIQEAKESGGHTLKRSLGSASLVSLGVGAIIGAGLFSLTGIAAAETLAGLCYAEFASMIPVAGSAYTYSYATMGEFMAWIIGWDLVLEYALASATVAVSWSQYVNELLIVTAGVSIPLEFLKGPWEGGVINVPAIGIVCLLSLLLIKGTKESSAVNNMLVVLKVSVVLIFIALGWGFVDSANHVPFVPANEGEEMVRNGEMGLWSFLTSDHFGKFGISGILRAAGVLFFAFVGFDAVSTAAQEAKNPKKGMPIGIIGSLVACTVLYVLFSYVMTGLEHYSAFAGDAKPVATAFAKTGYTFLNTALIVTIIAGYTSVILVMLLGQSRVFYAMSKDGLLPKVFSELSKSQTPWKTNAIFMVFMVSIGTLFAFTLVCIGVLVLRRTNPDIERPFRTPFVPVLPIVGVVVCLLLMASLPVESWERLGIWLLIGLAIYLFYGRRHSRIRNM